MEMEFLVYGIKRGGMPVRSLSDGRIMTLKGCALPAMWEMCVVTADIGKEWRFKGHYYASGKILSCRFVGENDGIPCMEIRKDGLWDPGEIYGREDANVYYADYLKEGLRDAFVFADYTLWEKFAPETDPVSEAMELKEKGDWIGARNLLVRALSAEERCIDALVHLGNLMFDSKLFLSRAVKCYETAVWIAERGLPAGFDGVFSWDHLENRPYIRALHGMTLSLWKEGNHGAAALAAEKLLRRNPEDARGIRFCLPAIRAGEQWKEDL